MRVKKPYKWVEIWFFRAEQLMQMVKSRNTLAGFIRVLLATVR